MKLCFARSCFWHSEWEMGFMYQIPIFRAVHILFADTKNPQAPVAKQVTMCFKSLPDGSFSKSQMKNRGGGGAGLPRENQYRYDAETKRVSYSRDGRWFIDRSSSTYIAGGTCQTPDNKHELLFSGALQRVVVK